MNIMIFDTETTSLNKPFCYNIGYVVYNTDEKEILLKKDFIVEQIWHNIPLFSSAYYADKRPIYVNRMKSRKVKMEKFGYITREMYRTIKTYNIKLAFAYNSSFDEKVFEFNCDYFKVINPFDTVEIRDIRGFVHNSIAFTKDFQTFCETHEQFTDNGNYSTTAETIYRYITKDNEFTEEHTALSDALIETEILAYCTTKNCEIEKEYKVYRSIPRKTKRIFILYNKSTDNTFITECHKMTVRKGREKIKVTIE